MGVNSKNTDKQSQQRPLWLQRLALIGFGVLLLLGFEGGLRLFWHPALDPITDSSEVAIYPYRLEGGVARTRHEYLGAMRDQSFTVPKPAGTFRIICLGGSTTVGFPHAPVNSWPAGLNRRLQSLFSEQRIEVINAAGNSYGTGRILGVLRGILQYQPDLLLVVTGDNDFSEDAFRTAIAGRSSGIVPEVHRLYLSRMLKSILPSHVPPPLVDAEEQDLAGFLFAPSPSGTVYQATPERRQQVKATLAENLHSVAATARAAGIPLWLGTVPARLAAWPPDPDPALPEAGRLRAEWRRLWQEGRTLLTSGADTAALPSFGRAAALWAENAEFCYDYGQLLLRLGQPAEARVWLIKARDLDPVPVRVTSEVLALIRQIAEQERLPLLDLEAAFHAASPLGISDATLLFDYAHPTLAGNDLIASLICRRLVADFSAFQGVDEEAMADLDQKERQRATQPEHIGNPDLAFALGVVFERKGELERAVQSYRDSIIAGNRGVEVRHNLARVLSRQGRLDAALAEAQSVAREAPQWERNYGLLGSLLVRAGQFEEALLWYRRALATGNPNLDLYRNASSLALQLKRPEEALQFADQGLARAPGDCRLQARRGRALEVGGDLPAAEGVYKQTVADDSTCHEAWENLGLLLMHQRRWTEAAAVFATALQQPEPLSYHYLNLGYVYDRGLQDRARAATSFREFLAREPKQVELVPSGYRPDGPAAGAR